MKPLSKNMFVYMAQVAWRHAGVERSRMVLFYTMLVFANIALSCQPLVLAQIINTVQKNAPDALHEAIKWSVLYGSLIVVFWSLHGPARVVERRFAFNVYRDFVSSLYRKVTEMPLRWHQDHHSGGTINRVNKAGKAVFLFTQEQFVIIQTAIRFIASLAMLAYYSWWVAGISVAVSVVIVATIRLYDKTLLPLIRTTNERDHHLNAALYDYIGNIVTVLTLRLQSNTGDEIARRFDMMRPSFWKETMLNEVKWGTISMMLNIVQAAIVGLYVGVHLWSGKPLVIGTVVAIFQYLLIISQMFFQATLSYEQLMYRHTDARGVDGLIEDHERLADVVATDYGRQWKNIHISGLNFTHLEGEDVLHHLRNVSLNIAAGQKIALIGGSGSGKTTLLTLLRGLYEAQHVRLMLDDDTYESLLPLAGFTTLVPQDSEIFENTVLYNLTLGTDVSEATLQQAMTITTFADVAPKLPEGIYTDIRERGVNLSGGQKQRLALARGLVAARNSSLLLLDEPTSSVDLPTEGIIFDRLFAAFADKAIVASIHRLHLLPRFDMIGLMKDGVIIEQGSFPELIARQGEFYNLWQHHLAQSNVGENI
jgi:ABC-type multidrug transport system fused ATPase/permease subunit